MGRVMSSARRPPPLSEIGPSLCRYNAIPLPVGDDAANRSRLTRDDLWANECAVNGKNVTDL